MSILKRYLGTLDTPTGTLAKALEAVRQRAPDAAGDGERLVLRDPWGTSVALVAH